MCRIFPHAFVDQFRKQLAVNEASSPLGIISSSRLCSHYFIKRFALFLKHSNSVANGREHVAILIHLRFAADRAVPRNDDGLICHHREICFRGLDHPVKASTSRIIDEWVVSVPPGVAGMKDISFSEISRDVAIGMSWAAIFERDSSAVEMKRFVGVEHFSRNRPRRPWRESEVPIFNSRAGGKMSLGVFVSGNSRTRGMHPLVAVSVIEMPMRVDQMLDRIGIETA